MKDIVTLSGRKVCQQLYINRKGYYIGFVVIDHSSHVYQKTLCQKPLGQNLVRLSHTETVILQTLLILILKKFHVIQLQFYT